MRCDDFQNRLSAYLAEELSQEDWQRCEEHLSTCEDCLALWLQRIETDRDSETNRSASLPDSAAHSLTENILKRTELNPCRASEEILCDFVDGGLGHKQRSLLLMHLQSCDQCAQTDAALSLLAQDLPLLASVEPPAKFAARILRKTLPWPTRLRRSVRLSGFDLQSLIQRPRFSLEAAFTFTLLWMTVFGVPTGITISAEAEQLVNIDTSEVQQRLVTAQTRINEGMNRIPELFAGGMDSLQDVSKQVFENGIDLSRQRGSDAWGNIQGWFRELDFEFSSQRTSN